jgi:hypothetical protein
MIRVILFLLVAFLSATCPSIAGAVGFAHNKNFIVYTPAQSSREEEEQFADLVLERAMAFRREFAQTWLGEELPDGAGRSVIHVDFSATDDRGLTWAKDHPARTLHSVYLKTSPESATGSTLQHEVAHTVLATRFPHPHRLPPWVEEGIACRYDDNGRKANRERTLRAWAARTDRSLDIAPLLEMPDIKSLDEGSYTAAASLVSFLLTRGDEKALLRFAVDGQRAGWDVALRTHYKIAGVSELQASWQRWLGSNYRK